MEYQTIKDHVSYSDILLLLGCNKRRFLRDILSNYQYHHLLKSLYIICKHVVKCKNYIDIFKGDKFNKTRIEMIRYIANTKYISNERHELCDKSYSSLIGFYANKYHVQYVVAIKYKLFITYNIKITYLFRNIDYDDIKLLLKYNRSIVFFYSKYSLKMALLITRSILSDCKKSFILLLQTLI